MCWQSVHISRSERKTIVQYYAKFPPLWQKQNKTEQNKYIYIYALATNDVSFRDCAYVLNAPIFALMTGIAHYKEKQ